jgi:hypothetical protein
MRRYTALLFLILVVTLAACGDTPTTAPVSLSTTTATSSTKSATSTTGAAAPGGDLNSLVGATGKDKGFTATVTKVERTSQVQDTMHNSFVTPPAGSEWVIVYLDVKNEGNEPGNFWVLNLMDGKGRRFTPDISNAGMNAESATSIATKREQQIQPGLSGKNFIIFQIPSDTPATGFKLGFGL